jgi:hypothetical protein
MAKRGFLNQKLGKHMSRKSSLLKRTLLAERQSQRRTPAPKRKADRPPSDK